MMGVIYATLFTVCALATGFVWAVTEYEPVYVALGGALVFVFLVQLLLVISHTGKRTHKLERAQQKSIEDLREVVKQVEAQGDKIDQTTEATLNLIADKLDRVLLAVGDRIEADQNPRIERTHAADRPDAPQQHPIAELRDAATMLDACELLIRPIVGMPLRRPVMGLEITPGIRQASGTFLSPRTFEPHLKSSGELVRFYAELLRRLAQIATGLSQSKGHYAVQMTVPFELVSDPTFPRLIRAFGSMSVAHLIGLTFDMRAFANRSSYEQDTLEQLRQTGVSLQLKSEAGLNFDAADCRRSGISQIQLRAADLLSDLSGQSSMRPSGIDFSTVADEDLLPYLKTLNMDCLISEVESEQQIQDLNDLRCEYAMGDALSKPRMMREALISGAA